LLRILLIEDRIPAEISGSGFGRTADILHALTESGALVSVWSLHQRTELDVPAWTNGAWTLLPSVGGPRQVGEYLARYGDSFDVVWVCRTHNFRALRHALLAWRSSGSGRRVVVDTEALATLREASEKALCGAVVSPAAVSEAIRAELPDLWTVDRVVTINARDAVALRDTFGIDAKILGHRFPIQTVSADFAERQGIAFLGALYGPNTPNYDSLLWFIQDVLPL